MDPIFVDCKQKGCDRTDIVAGYCGRHYQQFRTHGYTDLKVRPTSCGYLGCTAPLVGLGYCNKHYIRFKTYGFVGPDKKSRQDRFWDFVTKTESCWIWNGSKSKAGYGYYWDNKHIYAHRFSYEICFGKIRRGLTLDHLCRNTSCVNPEHLEPVTMKENILRGEGWAAKNARKTHCKCGQPLVKTTRQRYCRVCANKSDLASKKRRKMEGISTNG